MIPEYTEFTGYIKEMLRNKVKPLFDKANVDMKEFDKLNIGSNIEIRFFNQQTFGFFDRDKTLIMPILNDDPDLGRKLDGLNPKSLRDRSIKELAEKYFNAHLINFAHEVGHYLDLLVRGEKEYIDEYDEYYNEILDSDKSGVRTDREHIKYLQNYSSKPTEMIAIINEIRQMRDEGLSDKQILEHYNTEYEFRPVSYFESLLSMAKKKEEKLVFGKYITIIAVEQDTSGTVLNQWLDAGFREVVWIYQEEPWQDNKKWLEQGSTCPTCLALGGQHFKIQELLADMTHDAPKYSKSHVGCKCLMKRIPREEEILDYPEETPITEEAPKAEELPKAEEAPAVEEPPKPEETQNP